MTKSKVAKKRAVETKLTGFETMPDDWFEKQNKRRKLGERRAKLRELHEDVVIHPCDVRPGDVIEIRKIHPRKRRDRRHCKWRVQYDDSGNGYMVLAQEGNYHKAWADKYKNFYDEHGFPMLDAFNLAYGFAKFVLPSLKVLMDMETKGVPDEICDKYPEDDPGNGALHEWEQIMQDIYDGLSIYAETNEGKQLEEKMGEHAALDLRQKGLKLFQKYLYDLWI